MTTPEGFIDSQPEPKRIDPPDCGCTDCITGYSRPARPGEEEGYISPAVSEVWVVYSRDRGPYAISIHATAEEAAQVAAKTGYAHAGMWPLGMDLDDAIKAWEGRS